MCFSLVAKVCKGINVNALHFFVGDFSYLYVYILFRQSSPLQVPFHTLDLLLSLIPALSLSLTPLASLPFPGPSVLPTSFSFLLQAFPTC